MRPPASGAWSVLQPLLAEHWDAFQRAPPRDQTADDDGLVAPRLAWGHAATLGYVAYRCLRCGQGTHRGAMRWPAARCVRCAKAHVDTWGSPVRTRLHAGGISRPILLTVPALCRTTCSQHAAVVLSAVRRWGGQCREDF